MGIMRTGMAALAGLVLAVTGLTESHAQTTMDKIMQRGELRVAVQTQGPPVSFVDKDGERTGLAVEIVKMMAKDIGVELDLQDYDWKGLIPALLSDKVDMIAADMTPTPQRATQLIFTNPIFFTSVIAFTTKDKDFTSWEELNSGDVSVGATQASTYSDAAKKKLPDADLKEYAGGTSATVEALVQGRVDAGISDSGTIKGFLSQNEDLKLLDGSLTDEPLSFATRPDTVHLMFFLDNYIRFIRYNGTLEEMIDYWWTTTEWEKDHK